MREIDRAADETATRRTEGPNPNDESWNHAGNAPRALGRCFKNLVVGGYLRVNDNWGLAVQEQYEGATDTLQEQRYAVYRDLTSWVASFGGVIRDNSGVKEYGLLFTVTLKAFPKFGFDLNFDPTSSGD